MLECPAYDIHRTEMMETVQQCYEYYNEQLKKQRKPKWQDRIVNFDTIPQKQLLKYLLFPSMYKTDEMEMRIDVLKAVTNFVRNCGRITNFITFN